MIIYMGAIRACVDFLKWMFRERKPEEVAKGGDGALYSPDEQEGYDIARLKDGVRKCYSCGYVKGEELIDEALTTYEEE